MPNKSTRMSRLDWILTLGSVQIIREKILVPKSTHSIHPNLTILRNFFNY
jgi:hypothetical protein